MVEVRPFRPPTVNFGAAAVSQLISWDVEAITEPPLLRRLSDGGLQAIVETPPTVVPYPVHTQAVERAVKTVTRRAAGPTGRRRVTSTSAQP